MFTTVFVRMSTRHFEKLKKIKTGRPFTVLDAILAVTLAVAIGLAFVWVYGKDPSKVVINTPDRSYEYLLGVKTSVELEHLTVHIDGGMVWVTDADCPDKVCVNTGTITRSGQSIVCLPSGVVVTIVDGDGDLQWEVGR